MASLGMESLSIHGHGPTPTGGDDDIRFPSVVLGLGDGDGGVEVVVGQGGVEDFMDVGLEVGRLEAAWD